MHTTSPTLLSELRRPGARGAWDKFADLYTPLLYYWARGQGLAESDAADLVQEVFLVLVVKLPTFRYEIDGSFRGWLRTVTLNKHRELRRRKRPEPTPDLDDLCPARNEGPFEEREYRLHLVHRMLVLLRDSFPPSTWQMFHACAVESRDPREVARERNVSVGTVYAAKSKVLHRLRQELLELLQ